MLQVTRVWQEKGEISSKWLSVSIRCYMGAKNLEGKRKEVNDGYLSTPGYLVRKHYGGKSSKWIPEYARLLG